MPPGLSENELPETFSDHHHHHHHSNRMSLTREPNLTYRKLSVLSTNPPMDRKSVILIGVTLADEKGFKVAGSTESNRGHQFLLGTACIEDLNIKVEELRRLLGTEIPSLPSNFCFLTKEGWPLLKSQETALKANHVVNERNNVYIKKQFEKQRVGVVAAGGDPLGFIFTEMNCDLRQIREALEQQLKMGHLLKSEYRFIEKNGWPVMSSQESMLSLLDIMLLGAVIYIQSYTKPSESSTPSRPTSVGYIIPTTADSRTPVGQDSVDGGDAVRRKKSLKFLKMDGQNSDKGRKESQKRTKSGKDDVDMAKPILISYVRAEAAKYALDLKQTLVAEGFSVYLDVHEIKTGTDWQDALNFAVTHCFLFVPLITPMYGKTQWTNREIKLADVLGKLIVPVNFVDQWPPACLAIQFASKQYIQWKLQENDHMKGESEKPFDPRAWPESQLKRVTYQIADCYKDNCEKFLKRQLSNNKDKILIKNRPLLSVKEENAFMSPVFTQDDVLEPKHKIVISAHPKQRYMAHGLKMLFEKDGHDVWCSMISGQENLSCDDKNASLPDTPRDLPMIAEEVFFNHQDSEIFKESGENKRSASIYYREPGTYGRRPLSRLMSQFSDISQPSALSQEELDRLHTFQKKVDSAGVVVVLVSEEYTKSSFSQEQIFYCEHRKRVVMIRCDNSPIPKWLKLLMGNNMILKSNPQFECVLKARVKRALNPSSSETPKDATFEAKINYLVNFLKCNNALQDTRVYITGSSKLQTTRAEDICKAIGRELAKASNLSLVTGGFFGAPEITAKAFYDAHDSSTQSYIDDGGVVHILPIHETEDLSSKARQNPDGSFEAIPYGKTFFIGDTLKERETVVARMVDMCIVIEGGPGVVHEVEEFIWNDHFVIPIRSTGGAAGGKYGIPMKIFELPPGVDSAEWSVLSDIEASAENVAKAVMNIIFSLRKAVSPTNTLKAPRFGIARKNRKKSKKNRAESPISLTEKKSISSSQPSTELENNMNKYTEHSQHGRCTEITTFKRESWWRRILRRFTK